MLVFNCLCYALRCGEVLETFEISSPVLLPIKLPVASAVWIAHFEALLNATAADCLLGA